MTSQRRQLVISILATIATAVACALVTTCFLPDAANSIQDAELTSLTPNTPSATDEQLAAPIPSVSNEKNRGEFALANGLGEIAQEPAVNNTKKASSDAPFINSPTHSDAPPNEHQFSEEELRLFASLPPMCTTDLNAHISRPQAGPPEVHQEPKRQPEWVQPVNTKLPSIASANSALQSLPAQAAQTSQTASLEVADSSQVELANNIEPVNSESDLAFSSENHDEADDSLKDNSLTNSFAKFMDHPNVTQASFFDSTPLDGQAHADFAFHSTRQSVYHFAPHGSSNSQVHAASAYSNIASIDDPKPEQDPHLEIYSRSAFPSAKECAQCHKQIYEEWAASSHAYASISPMFHVFEETINRLSQGTIGYFCYRCHSPVSTTMGLRRDQPIWDGPRVFREGVTCIACHRVKTPYGKVDGERRIEPGDITQPVYGSGDGSGVSVADKYRDFFKVKTDNTDSKAPGQAMHRRAIQFEELSKSSFCMSCHQVAVEPGIKLEVVWDQYRASPAYRDGVTCQDCHMGRVPGVDAGYSVGPGAVVNGKVINAEKQHSNHVFYGPGYSIAHPGIFPDNLDADRWTVPQWLEFDWRAGWGTDAFEDALADGKFSYHFPPVWAEADDRYDAREIVDANLKKLEYKRDLRRQVLENGSKLDGPFFNAPPVVNQPLQFRYCVTNLNPGHNMPSGSLGAQPQIWMNVVLIDPNGNRIWETGYLDSNGDLADNHSLDVLARTVPLDTQLVNFQTKFLTTNVKGTDREMYLPVNFDFDQLPFLRPPQQPVSVINHPPFIRMEGHSIPPLGKRNAKFSVPSRLIQTPGTYRLSVRMRSRAEPIYFMRFCNATPEMQRMMNEWICDFHTSTVTFDVQ